MKIATILDEFSEACFVHEFDRVRLTQKDYVEKLKDKDIKFLLVESAWRGSGKTWCLASSYMRKNPGTYDNLVKLLRICKKKKIPTVFWNKEDPAHYSGFLQAAQLFDYIFTTDFKSKDSYAKDLKHNRIYTLPFAAQPKIHWPYPLGTRLHKPCFAGTYWSRQHKKRASDMNHILQPALPYGIDIFDRNVMTGCGEKWPGIYRSHISGGMPYAKLVEKYRRYRVFMNVNCIVNSLTMFSRRVFEILACGTPIISSYALGITQLLPSVCTSLSEDDTTNFLDLLLNNDSFWSETAIKGIREVYSQHTYAHRAAYICKVLGIPFDRENRLTVYKNISEMQPFDYAVAQNLIKDL
jgi:hypothetical protein